MGALFVEVDTLKPTNLEWPLAELGVSEAAFEAISAQRIEPHKLFVHPKILNDHPHLVGYYRNLVAVSRKGIAQLGLPTARFEKIDPPPMPPGIAFALAQTLNSIISKVIEASAQWDLETSRDVAFAELGTELQGTWANMVGKGATKSVEDIIDQYIVTNDIGKKAGPGRFAVANGWTIVFGSEPDIKFTDQNGVERIVVEIKGSLDRAGAQTRYGEAKKSFGKALLRNPRCHTVYLASCFTESVDDQIKADGQVRDTFNLTSILSEPRERDRFLDKLFHVVNTPA